MECFNCGTVVDTEDNCPHCGASIKAYRLILQVSNVFYNEALERANVRDLSGAISSLKKSLEYNKYNIDARNLLGLVYFEIGETVLALSEWVIAKNFAPENELVDHYLSEIQNSAGMLDKMNQTIKKYNQTISYCQQGSRDMAMIQLRKVLGLNPNLVAGHQLLALLYMQDSKYEDARQELIKANKIDVKNTTTLRYMKEVKERIKEQNQNKKKKRKQEIVSFQDGNDTVVMPGNSFRDAIDNSRASILNIMVGVVIGLLICIFLIVPTVRQSAKNDAANALVNANEELSTSSSNVSSLQKQVETLQAQLDAYTGKGDVVTSYEKLIEAQDAYNRNDLVTAGAAIAVVNGDLLDANGKAIYDTITTAVNEETLQTAYAAGYSAFRSTNYDEAITNFTTVLGINENYRDGEALYYMGESYRGKEDSTNATTYYSRIIELFPDTSMARRAQQRIDEMAEAAGTTPTTDDTTDTQE